MTADLTSGAEALLDEAFGISALAGATVDLGSATVSYSAFGWGLPLGRF